MDGGALLVLAQPTAVRNATVEHAYRQESFFYYLTGLAEPEAALLYLPFKPAGQRTHLFLRPKDPTRELWEGRRLGIDGAKASLAIDEAHSIGKLWDLVPDLLGEASKVYFHFGLHGDHDRQFLAALAQHRAKHSRRRSAALLPVYDGQYLAGQLRLRKHPEEIDRLRAAASVTRQTFGKIYKTVRPGLSERDIHALILGEFYAGGDMEAYGSIVASGSNACVLHYHENNQPLRDGELLLIDAGAQYDYYASDVTRTMPIGRCFTPEQRAVYDVVLAAQKAAISKAVPGSTLVAVDEAAVSVLVDGMLDFGWLSGSREEIVTKMLYRKYYPHGTSHWIGMDVHDVGIYWQDEEPVRLAPGMYFSVEPGLYIDPQDTTVPMAFRGIGVRIEDDLLITEGGAEVITAGIEKEAAALEHRF
jgi:Xaa-Pro aminopeptidase